MQVSNTEVGVLHIVMDEPQRWNPVTDELVDRLQRALGDPDIAAVVISAADGPAFSSGGDLALGPSGLLHLSRRLYDFYWSATVSPTVVIVAANGEAIGAGAQLVLCADLRFVGPQFRLRVSLPDRALGGGMWALPADVGRTRALDLLLTGRQLDATESVEWGLASEAVNDPVAAAMASAQRVAALPVEFRARIKRGISLAALLPDALIFERDHFTPPRNG